VKTGLFACQARPFAPHGTVMSLVPLRSGQPKGVHDMESSRIREHMQVIGADGVNVGIVDRVEGNRIKLTKRDSGQGSHKGHHHYISTGLVAGVEGDKVRLSAKGDVAATMEEEEK
jgi:hypothetical protein